MRSENLSGATSNEDWISGGEVPDPNPLPSVPGKFLLIRPVPIRERTKGGIIIPETSLHNMQYLNTVGRVLAVGNLAYSSVHLLAPVMPSPGEGFRLPEGMDVWDVDKENGVFWVRNQWCKVGDIVGYAKYAGARFLYKGVKLVLMNDEDIRLVISDPKDIDPSYNYVAA